MSSLGNDGLVVGIKGAGIAPAVISVIRGVAVAVTVTAAYARKTRVVSVCYTRITRRFHVLY